MWPFRVEMNLCKISIFCLYLYICIAIGDPTIKRVGNSISGLTSTIPIFTGVKYHIWLNQVNQYLLVCEVLNVLEPN